MSKKSILLFIAGAMCAFAAAAQDFQQAIDRFAGRPYMRNASVGVCVASTATGEVLASNQPDLAITTASTMKTCTSAAAIELLGKDFQFHTQVSLIGQIKGKRLHGNVVVKGFGDPTLGSRHFSNEPNIVDEVVNILQQQGINRIDGCILYDESAYPFETFNDNWMIEDLAYDYGPGVHAINYHDNLVKLTFDRSGDVATNFVFTPPITNCQVICHAQVSDEQNMYRLLNIGPNPNITLYGDIRRSTSPYSDYFVNPNPAQLLCDSIEHSLERADIQVKNKEVKPDDLTDTLQVVDHLSPKLTDIVTSLLDRSDNMFTEALLRAIAYNQGKVANTANGLEAVKQLWNSKGIDTKPLFQRDGSGLARNGKATARFFTQMLRQALADSTLTGVMFPSLMTHLGVNANIGKMIKSSPLKGKIASKSGSMSDVQCYVGYFPADNPQYTWAVLVNNWQGSRTTLKDDIEALLLELFTQQKGTSHSVND
ncbi:MAG: D-alanyl-D-alanine carboxypeptidase/D-alanyl-D-alanine-endopeptidase [Muribaculaceae bacterium]